MPCPGRLVRFEALARWNHPTLGTIPPGQIHPESQRESGLIIPMGAYILEQACIEAIKWQSLASDPIQVAVNVSSIQFARVTFVDEVADILTRTGMRPELLQLGAYRVGHDRYWYFLHSQEDGTAQRAWALRSPSTTLGPDIPVLVICRPYRLMPLRSIDLLSRLVIRVLKAGCSCSR